MKKTFTLFLFFFCSLTVFSQNYQLLNDGQTAYYQLDNSFYTNYSIVCDDCYFGASTDSFAMVGNDKIVYHKNALRHINPYISNCFEIADTSWLGLKTVIKPNGDYLFFSTNNDTALVKSQANLGDTWRFFTMSSGYYVEATVSSIQIKSIYGVSDHVKILSFILFDNTGSAIPIPTYLEMEISENYGLIKAPDFSKLIEGTTIVNLVGHSALTTNFKNITFSDIYDFDINDEFHTLQTWTPAPDYQQFTYEKKIVTSKQILTNQVEYIFDIESVKMLDSSGISDTIHTFYQATEVYDLQHFSDILLPYNSYSQYADSIDFLNYYKMDFEDTDGNYMNGQIVKRAVNIGALYNRYDSCNIAPVLDGYTEKEYIEGAGGPYNYGWGFDPNTYILKYFKKGTTTWGVPFDMPLLSNTSVVSSVQNVEIFPNPVKDKIQIKLKNTISKNAIVNIYHINGSLAKHFSTVNSNVFDVSSLESGLYILEINDTQSVWISKFLKD